MGSRRWKEIQSVECQASFSAQHHKGGLVFGEAVQRSDRPRFFLYIPRLKYCCGVRYDKLRVNSTAA